MNDPGPAPVIAYSPSRTCGFTAYLSETAFSCKRESLGGITTLEFRFTEDIPIVVRRFEIELVAATIQPQRGVSISRGIHKAMGYVQRILSCCNSLGFEGMS